MPAGKVPEAQRDSIITLTPKTRDIRECTNWKGIILLSILGKIMTMVILSHMRSAVDRRLRQEQAGFRPG